MQWCTWLRSRSSISLLTRLGRYGVAQAMIDSGLAIARKLPQARKMLLKRIRLIDVPNR